MNLDIETVASMRAALGSERISLTAGHNADGVSIFLHGGTGRGRLSLEMTFRSIEFRRMTFEEFEVSHLKPNMKIIEQCLDEKDAPQ